VHYLKVESVYLTHFHVTRQLILPV